MIIIRSWLFVPADSEKKLAKGRCNPADALILDLEDAVADDRQEIARPSGKWLATAARPMLKPDTLVAPVPLHRTRLLKRRYNQSALLAQALCGELNLPICPDLLLRARRTESLDGKDREARQDELRGAIMVHPRREDMIRGRPVLLVDDVMTTGATLEACTAVCQAAGASDVSVLVLARVANGY